MVRIKTGQGNKKNKKRKKKDTPPTRGSWSSNNL